MINRLRWYTGFLKKRRVIRREMHQLQSGCVRQQSRLSKNCWIQKLTRRLLLTTGNGRKLNKKISGHHPWTSSETLNAFLWHQVSAVEEVR